MSQMNAREIRIFHDGVETAVTTPQEMAGLAGESFPLASRVEGGLGEAFDFAAWYGAWREAQGLDEGTPMPTHLKVEAADTFEAVIPWAQLRDAAVQYAMDGGPLPKGGPIRLYTPNGSSACLNVKSVVVCRLLYDEADPDRASYGFKNTFSMEDLRANK